MAKLEFEVSVDVRSRAEKWGPEFRIGLLPNSQRKVDSVFLDFSHKNTIEHEWQIRLYWFSVFVNIIEYRNRIGY